jgi:hypothetical protein
MTNPDAAQAIYDIIQMMLTIGLPLCMVAGWCDTEPKRKKKTTTRRAKRGRRTSAVKAIDLVKDRRMKKAKTEKARPLSDWEQMEIDRYFLKRNFIPL